MLDDISPTDNGAEDLEREFEETRIAMHAGPPAPRTEEQREYMRAIYADRAAERAGLGPQNTASAVAERQASNQPPAASESPQREFTVEEAAERAGCNIETVRRHIKAGTLKAHRVGGHTRQRHAYAIDAADLDAWL